MWCEERNLERSPLYMQTFMHHPQICVILEPDPCFVQYLAPLVPMLFRDSIEDHHSLPVVVSPFAETSASDFFCLARLVTTPS